MIIQMHLYSRYTHLCHLSHLHSHTITIDDQTRVMLVELPRMPGSNYINANYIAVSTL